MGGVTEAGAGAGAARVAGGGTAAQPPASAVSAASSCPPAVRLPISEVAAPIPGRVVRVQVQPGQEVGAGDVLLVLDAMKLENEIASSTAGSGAWYWGLSCFAVTGSSPRG